MKSWMNRRGSVAILAAAGMFSVVGVGGLAVDATRVWMVRSRLKASTDAAALVAARQFDQASRDADATAAFYANFNPDYRAGQAAAAKGAYLGAAAKTLQVTTPTTSSVKVAASADVPMTILWKILAAATGSEVVTVSESSTAGRAGVGLELALVIDTTWSMSFAAAGFSSKLAAAKDAVNILLDTLYGPADKQPNLWVSVVPFTTAVNIGTANSGWLTGTAYPAGHSWTGCVEARRNGEDITETSPSTDATKFHRYAWPSTYRQNGQYVANNTSASRCTDAQAYPLSSDGKRWCRGDNDWGATTAELSNNPILADYKSYGASFGPSAWCPASTIQPLTASKAAVKGTVDGLQTRFGFGTVVPVGLQAGWFTLSDRWQGQWPNPNGPGGPTLPTAYDTRNMQKVMVLLSDGDNNWYNARTMYSLANRSLTSLTAPENQRTELFYSGYGRLFPGYTNASGTAVPTENRLGVSIASTGNLANDYNTTQANADRKLDDRTKLLCEAIKARKIQIYAIGFEVTAGSAQETLLKNCASPGLYFSAPNASTLRKTFSTIAGKLVTPRLME